MPEMTREDIERRLRRLGQTFVGKDVIESMYGLELSSDAALRERMTAWAERRYSDESPVFEGNEVHRWRLETFLQQQSLLPVRWAAVRLGMTESSFQTFAEALIEAHLLDWDPDRQVIREDDVEGIRDYFDDLKWQVFEDHQAFCSTLHTVVGEEFGVNVEPLRCATSERLEDEPVLYARRFDALTDEPLSTVYEQWLETGKPIHLRPDACSTWTLVRHEDLLEEQLVEGEGREHVDMLREHMSNTDPRP